MKCSIRFCGTNGESETDGTLETAGEGFTLTYLLGGDLCVLQTDKGQITLTRTGGLNIKLRFSEGARTVCEFGDGQYTGSVEAFTKKLSYSLPDGGLSLSLEYELGGENIILGVTAAATGEKK